MKTLIYLFLVAMLLFAGCAKDEMFDQKSNNLELKKAKVPIPMKADFCMTPDLNVPPVHIEGLPWDKPEYYLPGGGWISGHATHMGEIIMEKSTQKITSAKFVPGVGVVSYSEGIITAANGDYYSFKAIMYSNPQNKTFTGTVEMFGGTGKFEGATGTVEMIGSNLCWTAEGFMEFDK